MRKNFVYILTITFTLIIFLPLLVNASDLIIYLPMDGKSNTDALKTHSDKNIKATANGNPKWKSSGGYNDGGVFEFDGNNDISLGDNFPVRSSYTKIAWIYWTGNGGKNAGNNIISGDESDKGHALWCPESYGNRLSAGHNAHWNIVQDKTSLERNRWYFVALTYDYPSGEMILYKDAVEVSKAKVQPADKDVNDPTISIGSFGYKNGWTFQGLIDDVRIYNRALSADEIKNIFKDKSIVANISQSDKKQESPKPKESKKQVKGFIVWESNRTGQWELYRANIDGSGFKKLTELAKIYPLPYDGYLLSRISPNGRTILFCYGRQKAPVEAWVMPSEGGEPRKLTVGSPLNWSPDGKIIYFVKDSKIWQYEFTTGIESIFYDRQVPITGKDGSVGDINCNLKSAVFRSEKSNEFFVFDKGATVKTMGGCEPSFSPDGRYVYWVNGPKDFRVWDIEKNEEHQFLGTPDYENWNYTYCPRLSRDSKWLAYGASPNQHDHNTSDYDIFIQELKDWHPVGKPIRISQDQKTDRWADIFIQFDETPPEVPLNVKAEFSGQSIKLSWDKAQDPESEVLWYNVYISTKRDGQQLLAKVDGITYSDLATDAKVSYQYTISAVNSAELESPKSKPITIITRDFKPINPTNLSVTTGNRQAHLKWDPNPELDIKGYNIYRALDSKGKYKKINKEIVSESNYVDNSVENGKTYYYYITALDKAKHESQQSVAISKKIIERATEGLLAFYPFNEGKGNVVNDVSGVNPPINLRIIDTNKVSWVKGENAIEFTDNSMIVSDGNADKLLSNIKGRKELSIEVWFSPNSLIQNGPARIISMSMDPSQRNFTLGQVGEDIAFRLRTTKTDQNGIPELDTQKHILTQKPIHIIATYDGNTKRIYVNGNLHSASQQIVGDFSNWGSYPLVIGNELTGDRSWLGKLYLVGIYNRSLNSEEIIRNYQAGL